MRKTNPTSNDEVKSINVASDNEIKYLGVYHHYPRGPTEQRDNLWITTQGNHRIVTIIDKEEDCT
jgi:hypothetical protein